MMEKQFAESALALQLDKISWKKVSFGDVAMQQKKSVDREKTHLTKYVKGEHMGSEDLHLRSWGELADEYLGPAFIRFFEEGDILYGSRRTYLRKVAIAPFEGITSNTTFVIKANEEVIDKRLLPFVMLSEGFAEHSIKNSKGSVNPYINWKDIANYQFLLPPKAEQARLAELLWAMDEVIEKEKEVKTKFETFQKRYLFDSVSGKFSSDYSKWKEYRFGDLGESFGGLSGKTKDDFGEGSPFVNYMNIFKNSKVNPSEVNYVKIAIGENQNELKFGDILFTGSSETPEEVGMSSIVLDDLQGYYLNSFCFGFRLYDFDTLLPEYARFLLRGELVRKFMFRHAQGYTRFNLSKTTVKAKLKIMLPPLNEQNEISNKLVIMEKISSIFEAKISASQSLQKSLINQIF
jgi:type I restriction enzyme, S subunit